MACPVWPTSWPTLIGLAIPIRHYANTLLQIALAIPANRISAVRQQMIHLACVFKKAEDRTVMDMLE